MLRKIICIDKEKCNGCGLCASACHEGAIHMRDGKAELIRDDYCDGLGDCLPVCPENAISFEVREANAYVRPLTQWPVQIRLVSSNAAFFEHADLLIAADCTAFSYKNFHQDFMKNHVTLIGCPKLDSEDYSLKLAEILKIHPISSLTIARMEVPCCSGLENAVKKAVVLSGKAILMKTVIISTDGRWIR